MPTRIAHCDACQAIESGMKSRIVIPHTCGKTSKEIMEFMEEVRKSKQEHKNWFAKKYADNDETGI